MKRLKIEASLLKNEVAFVALKKIKRLNLTLHVEFY